jgi:hypothetical protein
MPGSRAFHIIKPLSDPVVRTKPSFPDRDEERPYAHARTAKEHAFVDARWRSSLENALYPAWKKRKRHPLSEAG